jgi:hypothetical protein
MRKLSAFIHHIPELVEWFKEFTEIDYSTLERDHPLWLYYEEYEKWSINHFGKQPIKFDDISNKIIDFGSFLKVVQLFQHQIKDKIKNNFISDLKDKSTCYGVLFEIRILGHFYKLGVENLSYRDNHIDGKNPDIMFTTRELRRVFVECTRKYAKSDRSNSDIVLIEDLIRSLNAKAIEYKDLPVPLIYAVHVPEDIDFARDKFKTELKNKLYEILKLVIFRNVNYVVFSSYKSPEKKPLNVRGDVIFNTDLDRLLYQNQFVDPKFKVDMNF